MSNDALVGILIVAHGQTASTLLSAARGIVGGDKLVDGVEAIDSGAGYTEELAERVHQSVDSLDQGKGVVLLVDLLGASPCSCAMKECADHRTACATGLNLAMLLKIAVLDRKDLSPAQIVEACVESGKRSMIARVPNGGSVPEEGS